jgi:hypothetical protein
VNLPSTNLACSSHNTGYDENVTAGIASNIASIAIAKLIQPPFIKSIM